MSKSSFAKTLRKRKRQLKQYNEEANRKWIDNFKFVAFFQDKNINKLRLPSGLFVGKEERHPAPTQDPTKSNKTRLVERRLQTGRLGVHR